MQKIVPNLWFTRNASEAVDFYLSVFKDSKIISTAYYPEAGLADFQQSFAGKVLSIDFELNGQLFASLNFRQKFTRKR